MAEGGENSKKVETGGIHVRIKLWDSGREELRKLPIICPFCEKEVQISGTIEDGELKWDDCPNCQAMITGAFYSDDEEEYEPGVAKYPVSAEVKWMIEGAVESERTSKIGSAFSDFGPVELLSRVLVEGAGYFQRQAMPPSYILSRVLWLVLEVLPSQYMEEIIVLCQERIAEAAREIMEDED
jgi:hypothetical protein